MADLYKIVRMFYNGGCRTIKTGLTLEEAKAHCSDPQTSSKTAKGRDAYTRIRGQWFDGYALVPARKVYVQRFGQGQRETVDEFDTRSEALKMAREYRLGDPSAEYYLSTRPCGGWEVK